MDGFVPQTHLPGQDAEVDFAEVWVDVGGVDTQCFLFTLRMSFSGKAIHRVYSSRGQEAFFAGHVAAFTELGGVPAGDIRYDKPLLRGAQGLLWTFSRRDGPWVLFNDAPSPPQVDLLKHALNLAFNRFGGVWCLLWWVGAIGCVKIYGDIAEGIKGARSGNTLSLQWAWGMDTTKVTAFRVGSFNFNVFDCNTDKVVWHKDYSYSTGTSLRHANGSATVGLTIGHRYAVQVWAWGTYQRRFPNGTKGEAYIGDKGPGGKVVSLGSCV